MIDRNVTNLKKIKNRKTRKKNVLKSIYQKGKVESKSFKVREEEINYLQALEILTPREIQILKRIIKAYTNKKIASELFISERTVEKHRENISKKLNIMGYHAILKWYYRNSPTT